MQNIVIGRHLENVGYILRAILPDKSEVGVLYLLVKLTVHYRKVFTKLDLIMYVTYYESYGIIAL